MHVQNRSGQSESCFEGSFVKYCLFYFSFIMPRWSEKQSCTFVSLYKDFDCLWNVFDPSYKNRGMRTAAFEYIVKVMNIPSFTVNDVPKKIRSFRSTYNQELLKVSKSQKSGADDDDVYYPTVKWFDDMDYIMKNSNVADRPTMTDVVSLHTIKCLKVVFSPSSGKVAHFKTCFIVVSFSPKVNLV